jgi:uncharacterized protein
MHPAFQQTNHRPWPLPEAKWVIAQTWQDLAFIHYPVDPAPVQALLPKGLELQTFEGKAWIGVVPFEMARVAPRVFHGLLSMPRFPELNVRTYVTLKGKPGVWFLSLDTTSAPAVLVGRRQFHLPYHRARMSISHKENELAFSSSRLTGQADFTAFYSPTGPVFYPKPGSFEHWAAERYCLYFHEPKIGLKRVDVHHVPWPLQKAQVQITACTMLTAAGLPMPTVQPICHFSSGVQAVSYGAVCI